MELDDLAAAIEDHVVAGPGEVVILRMPASEVEKARTALHLTLEELVRDWPEIDEVAWLIMENDTSVEVLNHDAMNALGWFRREDFDDA